MDCSPPGSSVLGDSPGYNTGVGCHSLLQGIFPIQGSNPVLLHCKQILYHLSHQGSPYLCINIQYLSFSFWLTSLCISGLLCSQFYIKFQSWFYFVDLFPSASLYFICSVTEDEADHTLIMGPCMHWSRGWKCTDHVGDQALITWLIIRWSRDWSCPNHVADHALFTRLIIHWSHYWKCTEHLPDHALNTWLIMHWSRNSSYTDYETVHALITWLILHF